MMKHAAVLLALCLGMSGAANGEAAVTSFDRAGWLADFDAVREAMTRDYPNLEWAAERGMDLPAVVRRTRSRLEAANDEHQARFALSRFIQVFADGHLSLDWPSAAPLPAPVPSSPGPKSPLCERLGYAARPDNGAIASGLLGYQSLGEGANNPIGLVEAGGRRVGVLRIEAFMPGAADCAEAARQLGVSDDGECDDLCRARIANRAETSFVARLDERVRTLAASRPDLLLVDLARNGGGSDSAISAARMIGGGDLQAPRVARMAGEPLLADIKDDRALLRAALPGASAEDAALLRRLDSDLAQAEAQAQRTCDRSPLWRGERIGCTALVSGPFHAGGLLPGGLPGRQDGPDWVDPVDATVRHKYTPGSWKGPVLVLVDGDTASAAELFTAMLQDAGRARVIGAPSFGSGCGWMLPRRPVTLPHSGGRLLMPDCARFRRDGRNELDGVQPDFLVGLRTYDSARQRAERLRPKLDEAVAALLGPKRRR